MDPVDDLRHAIEWYLEALPARWRQGAGPPPDPDAVGAVLAEIEEAIAPLQLPAELIWFWRTWDARKFTVVPPHLIDPAFALDCWRQHANRSLTPRVLFPVAYESWRFLLVELGGPPDEPAPLWAFSYGDAGYDLKLASLASIFRSLAAAADAADGGAGDETDMVWDVYLSSVEHHLTSSSHADRDRSVHDHLPYWPARWQAAQGVDADTFARRGATHTVRSFVEAAENGAIVGRVVGRFRVKGGGGAIGPGGTSGTYGRLDDDTGSLRAVLPASVLDISRPGDLVEVELEAAGPVEDPPIASTGPIAAAAFRGHIASASEAAGEWVSELSRLTSTMPVIRRIVPAE